MTDLHLPESDLGYVFQNTSDIWEEIRCQRIFITGGTGFIGRWLLESLFYADGLRHLENKVTVLTRYPAHFQKKYPHIANHPGIHLLEGDVRSFKFPAGEYQTIIHGAAEVSTQLDRRDPIQVLDTIVEGTRHTLEFAKACKCKRLMFISSGAVYGKQPKDVAQIPEDFNGSPDPREPDSAYGEGKRLGELLCQIYSQRDGFEIKIARCFSAVGPGIPLDRGYAVADILSGAIASGKIILKGDGSSVRSYLYAADLTIWLWKILVRGMSAKPYNVGSDQAISILELAELVANCISPQPEIIVGNNSNGKSAVDRYVPSVQQTMYSLNINKFLPLEEALNRTIAWFSTSREQL